MPEMPAPTISTSKCSASWAGCAARVSVAFMRASVVLSARTRPGEQLALSDDQATAARCVAAAPSFAFGAAARTGETGL